MTPCNKQLNFLFGPPAVLALSIVLALSPVLARACECDDHASGKPLMELIRESKGTIFFGHVTSIREVLLPSGTPGLYIPMRDVTLRNIKKGSHKPRTVTVHTGTGSGDCGYAFVVGGEYMVEMYRSNGRYDTNICTLTRPFADYLSQTK